MALGTPTDYYSLADDVMLACKGDTENATQQNVESPMNDVGDVPANDLLAVQRAPQCEYEMLAAWSRGAETPTVSPVKLGKVTTVDGHSYMLTQLSINTSAGTPPVITANGVQVKDNAASGDYYALPAFSIAFNHRAMILWGAFVLTGTGCHFTSANYNAQVQPSRGTINGGTVSHDCNSGEITCAITVVRTGNTEPTLAAGEGWEIVSPLTRQKTDAQYPTYTATLKKYLKKTRLDAGS